MLPSSFQTKSEKAAKQLHPGPPRMPVSPGAGTELAPQGGGTRRGDTQPKGYPSKGERVWQLPPKKDNPDSKTRRIAAHAIPSLLSPLPPFPTQGGGSLCWEGFSGHGMLLVGLPTCPPPSYVSRCRFHLFILRHWPLGEGEGGRGSWLGVGGEEVSQWGFYFTTQQPPKAAGVSRQARDPGADRVREVPARPGVGTEPSSESDNPDPRPLVTGRHFFVTLSHIFLC